MMDCNKEEALRAKDIAQQKMQSKDFVGARKLALKAQKLYPDLENVAQMITVCDVHCSAEQKLYANEMDWYGILQVEPAAVEATIRKQYRKFALQLHPDKNRFPGAEGAFKLIGEAQRVLLDYQKRALHDMKCRVPARRPTVPPHPPQKVNKVVNVGPQMNMRGGCTYFNPPQQQNCDSQSATTHHSFNGFGPTFWTVCIYCSVRFQYYRAMLNKTVLCKSCNKTFIASELNEATTNKSREAFAKKNAFSHGTFKADSVCKANVSAEKPEIDTQRAGFQSNVSCEKQNSKTKRNRKSESSESSDSFDSSESEDVEVCGVNGMNSFVSSGENRRRSSRKKQKVSYKENLSDDDESLTDPSISHKEGGSQHSGIAVEKDEKEAKPKQQSHILESLSQEGNGSDDDSLSVPSKSHKEGGSRHSGIAVEKDQKEAKPRQQSHILESLSQKGNGSDDDSLSVPSKSHKEGGSQHSGIAVEKDQKEAKPKHSHIIESLSQKRNGSDEGRQNVEVGEDCSKINSEPHNSCKKDSISKAALLTDTYVCPDPEFSDFNVKEESFAVGQIWATYDTIDAMPRFYCQIKKVVTSELEVQIRWLEPDPDEEGEQNWLRNDLPISCGKFGLGHCDTYNEAEMFSHLVSSEKGAHKNTYKVHPQKGETWALFKNWDIMWYLDADAHQSFEYEFAEIVSDYVEGEGVHVAHLGKLQGFVSLFCRVLKNGVETYQVPRAELFRFSHRVPSFQMTGDEREGVPKGSYELDPACLPNKVEEISLRECLGVMFCRTQPAIPRSSPRLRKSDSGASTLNDFGAEGGNREHECKTDSILVDEKESFSKSNSKDLTLNKRETGSSTLHDKGSKGSIDNLGSSTSANADATEIPDPQFHNFAACKSEDNLRRGQIWAVYCDEDGMPKNYCQIKKIDSHPKFKLHVTWLSGSFSPDTIAWDDAKMPVSCGTFKVRKAKDCEYADTTTEKISHQVQAVLKRNEYHIFPKEGEIWALYKNWTPKLRISDLENSKYEVVEVLGKNATELEVLVLEFVKGTVSVFKCLIENGSVVTRKIPRAELYRFSHQIPAFKLTKEHDDRMLGFWELDTLAMPVYFFEKS